MIEGARPRDLSSSGLAVSRFRLDSLLGRGAVADVYRAYDPSSDREVALRIVRIEHTDPELLLAERSGLKLQESVSRIAPQVAKVFDYGDSDGLFFAATELVRGRLLSEILESCGSRPLSPEKSISIGIELCQLLEILQHFSEEEETRRISGIVHGDIKPSNIMISEDFRIRLLDFGVAKSLQGRLTTSNVFATLLYAAPERLHSGRVNFLSDLWSVSIILYEMLAGYPPFETGSEMEPTELENRIRRGKIRMLPIWVPQELARIVMRALQLDPKQRYLSAADLKQALENFVASEDFRLWERNVAALPETPKEVRSAVVYDHRTRRTLGGNELKARFRPESAADREIAELSEIRGFFEDTSDSVRSRIDKLNASVGSLQSEYSEMRKKIEVARDKLLLGDVENGNTGGARRWQA